MSGDLVIKEKPKLARCLIRYFMQGDYDLIDESEYFTLALYFLKHDLVELVENSDPQDVADLVQDFKDGTIEDEDVLEDAIMECGREAMAQYILNMAKRDMRKPR